MRELSAFGCQLFGFNWEGFDNVVNVVKVSATNFESLLVFN